MKKYICIDIGGTAIKYGMVNEKGNILERKQMATEASKGGPEILAKAVSIVETFVRQEEVSGICISTAGMVDVEQGSIFYSAPLIPDYIGTNFKKTMEERFHILAEVENDVNCAGWRKQNQERQKDVRLLFVLQLGQESEDVLL